jgi:hypothetical protein
MYKMLIANFFLRVKLPGCDVEETLPSGEIKNEWSYTSAPTIRLYDMDRDTCNFLMFIHVTINITKV